MAFQLFLPPCVLHRIGRFLPHDQLHIFGEGHDITPFYNPLGFLYNRADWQAQILQQLSQEWRARNNLPIVRRASPPRAPASTPQVLQFPIDLDMMFGKLGVQQLPEGELLDYHLLAQPLPNILPERPQDLIQLCPYPLAIYVGVPPPHTHVGWKKVLCQAFWQAGVEQPIPTHQAAHTLGTGVVKVPSTTFKGVLQMLGVGEVYVGRYGMKQYLVPDPDTALSQFQDIPTLHTSADFGHMIKEEGVMWLFGLPANQNGTFIDHPNNLKWRVLPLMPGAQRALGGYVYGTLEGKPLASGPFGSPECKMFQVYSLIHHTRLALTSMEIQYPSRPQDMANKKKALLQYTQQLLDHADRACGGRVEVRVKAPNDTPHSFKDLWPYGQMLLQHVQEMIHKGVIQIKKLPVDEAKAHIMAALGLGREVQHLQGSPRR